MALAYKFKANWRPLNCAAQRATSLRRPKSSCDTGLAMGADVSIADCVGIVVESMLNLCNGKGQSEIGIVIELILAKGQGIGQMALLLEEIHLPDDGVAATIAWGCSRFEAVGLDSKNGKWTIERIAHEYLLPA